MTPLDASSYASTVATVTRNAFAMPRAASLLEGTIGQEMAKKAYAEGNRPTVFVNFGVALADDHLRPIQADILQVMSSGGDWRFGKIEAALIDAKVTCSKSHLSSMVRALRRRDLVVPSKCHPTQPWLKISDKGKAALANFMAQVKDQ